MRLITAATSPAVSMTLTVPALLLGDGLEGLDVELGAGLGEVGGDDRDLLRRSAARRRRGRAQASRARTGLSISDRAAWHACPASDCLRSLFSLRLPGHYRERRPQAATGIWEDAHGPDDPDRHRRRHHGDQGGADRRGRQRGSPRSPQPHPTARPAPGLAEQDPADWMAGVLGGARGVSPRARSRRARAASASARRSTRMSSSTRRARRCCRRSPGRTRGAAADAAALDAQVTAAAEARLVRRADADRCQPRAVAHGACRGASEPDVYAAHRAMCCCPRTICVLQLTGAVGSDPISAVGLVDASWLCRAAARSRAAARRSGCRRSVRFSHVAGRVRPGLPCAGMPVVVGDDGCLGRHVRGRRRRRRRRHVPERHQRNPRHRLVDGQSDAGGDPVSAL